MRINRKDLGQSLIEFAILLPFLLLLIMALFDIGRFVFYYSVLNTAVREGTRFAIVQPNCDYRSDPIACDGIYLDSYPLDCAEASSIANVNICNEVSSKLFSISELSTSTIVIDHTLSSTDDYMIKINIDFLFKPITPGLGIIWDFTMHANSQMIMSPIARP